MDIFCNNTMVKMFEYNLIIIIIIIIIIIFNIYIAQINIQEDMIPKCALQIKIEYEITMLPIYNFEFTIKCEDVYYMKN